MSDIEPAARTIIWVFIGFIVAINLSLIFAFRDRNKTSRQGPKFTRGGVFRMRDKEITEELSRKVAALREQQAHEHEDADPPKKAGS